MSPYPRTDTVADAIGKSGTDWHHSATLMRRHANILEAQLTAANAMLADAVAQLAAIEAGLAKEYQPGVDKRSSDLIDDFMEMLEHHKRVELRLTAAVADAAALRKELAEVTAAFQKECDHDFVTEDHSFSHEFGTTKIFVTRCEKCGKDAEPGDVPDHEPPDTDVEGIIQ